MLTKQILAMIMKAPAVKSGKVRIWLEPNGFVVWRSLRAHRFVPYEEAFGEHALMYFQTAIAGACKATQDELAATEKVLA